MRGLIKNNRGQISMNSIFIGIFMTVICFSVLYGVMPDLTGTQNEGRNMNGLNCASGDGSFDVNGVPMYNASKPHDNHLTCLVSGYLLPYFFISVMLGIGAAFALGRIFGHSEESSMPVNQYPQYQ